MTVKNKQNTAKIIFFLSKKKRRNRGVNSRKYIVKEG